MAVRAGLLGPLTGLLPAWSIWTHPRSGIFAIGFIPFPKDHVRVLDKSGKIQAVDLYFISSASSLSFFSASSFWSSCWHLSWYRTGACLVKMERNNNIASAICVRRPGRIPSSLDVHFRIAPSALKENKIADAQDRLKGETISRSDEEPQRAIYINEVKRFFCGRRWQWWTVRVRGRFPYTWPITLLTHWAAASSISSTGGWKILISCSSIAAQIHQHFSVRENRKQNGPWAQLFHEHKGQRPDLLLAGAGSGAMSMGLLVIFVSQLS